MKTLDEWMEKEQNFKDYVEVGDEVDEAMVDHFMNILPPRSMSYGYLQAGEPYDHMVDKDGKWKGVYLTFCKEGDKWIYKGHCFPGETENQTRTGNPFK